ncbi:STAS domain-containing protein [Mycobacterium sp. MYCO198283]|uniref:STAS domain-containing protein n=1 Tax=Mycobacterium sp. MYCO198283 TaxID=2883505 RepID=UPI001E36C808|nr:STAS domain-containing protein [Mycobacterium sp. MYCO198283]MCG5434007.1 STAS domain-containing protein [Mycobacterium sp. MYCO198283]
MSSGTIRTYRPDPTTVDDQQTCGRATFHVSRLEPWLLLITVTGEIDATNGRALGRFAERHTGTSTQLVLDLGEATFFGSQGFTALHYLSVSCARSDVDWMVVAGREARRLLRIVDPDGALPTVDTVHAAVELLDRHTRRGAVPWAG